MSKPQRWILTGGIGSGKSTVGRMLRGLGAEVIDADVVGHEVISPGGAAFAAVSTRWPQVVEHGLIDRRLLGAIVFSIGEQLAELEALTHPHIREEILRRVRYSKARVVFVEASVPSILVSADWRMLVVYASRDKRLERLAERGLLPEDALKRMAFQEDREWLQLADHVIDNSGSKADLEGLVLEFARTIGLAV